MQEYLSEACEDEIRELCELPPAGNFQVLLRGEIWGSKSYSYEGFDEWDEGIDVEEVKSQPIPEDMLKWFLTEQERKRIEHETLSQSRP